MPREELLPEDCEMAAPVIRSVTKGTTTSNPFQQANAAWNLSTVYILTVVAGPLARGNPAYIWWCSAQPIGAERNKLATEEREKKREREPLAAATAKLSK